MLPTKIPTCLKKGDHQEQDADVPPPIGVVEPVVGLDVVALGHLRDDARVGVVHGDGGALRGVAHAVELGRDDGVDGVPAGKTKVGA